MNDFATKRMQRLYSNGQLTRFGTQFAFDSAAWTLTPGVATFVRDTMRVYAERNL